MDIRDIDLVRLYLFIRGCGYIRDPKLRDNKARNATFNPLSRDARDSTSRTAWTTSRPPDRGTMIMTFKTPASIALQIWTNNSLLRWRLWRRWSTLIMLLVSVIRVSSLTLALVD